MGDGCRGDVGRQARHLHNGDHVGSSTVVLAVVEERRVVVVNCSDAVLYSAAQPRGRRQPLPTFIYLYGAHIATSLKPFAKQPSE